ncbi:MAG: hypothetical protein GY820_45935, partial [Gammaproteobacteria bacterium]|nr:hypothetical protein [Gammaproteobacteria bacterium]
MSHEATYGESGEYQRDEVSGEEGSITPTRTPSASPSRQKETEQWKGRWSSKGQSGSGSQARAASSADVLDEEEREAEDEVNMPPIPVSQDELIEQGLNIDPGFRMHLVTKSFIKEKVRVMFEKSKLQQFKDLTV